MILTTEDVKVLRAAAIANKFVAERRMSDKESTRYDKYTPQNWFQKLPIVPQEETPPASGYGYVQSPYVSQWAKMWGVNPLTDLPKYRMMYRTVPIVKKAIDKTVATAISKGFEIDLPSTVDHREDILEYLKSWIDQQEDFKIHLQMLASDALTYGNAFAEIVYDEIEVTEERSTDPEFQRVEIPDPHEDYKIGEHGIPYLPTVNYNGDGKYLKVAAKGNPVWIKPLDPLWMRVRRDSYGNVFGYLQYLSTPPVAFTNDKTIHIRFNPKSWWTENAYGCIWENELVYTPNGLKRVLDISEGDSIYTYNNNEVTETAVEKLIDNGIQDSYELQTTHRSLIATDIHPFLMEDGTWKQLRDITIGDKIVTIRNSGDSIQHITLNTPVTTGRNLNKDIIIPKQVTLELARFWGFMLGDGWLINNGISFALGIDDECNKYYIKLAQKLFNVNVKYSDYRQAIINSKEINEFFKLNSWIQGSHNKCIPDWILSSDDSTKFEFIEGFIDADGYRYSDKQSKTIYQMCNIEICNYNLLRNIKIILDSLGFKSGNVRKRTSRINKSFINGREIKNSNDSYMLNFTYNKFEKNLIIESVKSISYTGKRHVYDIAVKGDSHNFIVNGLVAHNTSMLMSLVRTQEAIWTIENDLILISHACAKPPLVFACGDNTEEPWTEGQFTAFVGATSSRGPGGDIYHRGDVQAKPLPFPASSLAPLLAHLDYHKEQRMISLGVPPDLLGVHASSNRSVATVSFDDWINTIQLLQQQMGDAVQEQLFKPIVEKAFGEGCPVPNMVWNQVYEKDDAAEIQKVMTLRAASIITVNEARAWLGEVGKNFEPVEGGDSLLPPEIQMPVEESSPEMPGEDEILGDSVVEAKASERSSPDKTSTNLLKKGVKKIFGAEEEEYTDIKIRPPKVVEKETLEADIQGFAEPGTSSGTGIRDTTIYPLLERDGDKRRKVPVYTKKDKKDFLSKIASKLQTMEFAPIRAEQDKLSGQSNDSADYPEKDLRNVKIEKLEERDGVEVWIIDSQIAASRYDEKWGVNDGKRWQAGHHRVFDYIPENHIWLSDLVTVEERSKIILHEFTELKAMEAGKTYADAHLLALKTEGALTEAEIQKRSYIQPEEVKTTFTRLYPKIEEKENHWKIGDKEIIFDDIAGIIFLKSGDKIIDQTLIRGSEDLSKFLTKHGTGKEYNSTII